MSSDLRRFFLLRFLDQGTLTAVAVLLPLQRRILPVVFVRWMVVDGLEFFRDLFCVFSGDAERLFTAGTLAELAGTVVGHG